MGGGLRRSLIAMTAAGVLLGGCGDGSKATRETFAGTWWGHTRRLVMTRSGLGSEHIDSGCCHPVITIRFRVISVHGSAIDAFATIVATFVQVQDRSVYSSDVLHPRREHLRRLKGAGSGALF